MNWKNGLRRIAIVATIAYSVGAFAILWHEWPDPVIIKIPNEKWQIFKISSPDHRIFLAYAASDEEAVEMIRLEDAISQSVGVKGVLSDPVPVGHEQVVSQGQGFLFPNSTSTQVRKEAITAHFRKERKTQDAQYLSDVGTAIIKILGVAIAIYAAIVSVIAVLTWIARGFYVEKK
jgi:hypothetical protein